MAQVEKLEVQTQIRSSPDKFYEILSRKAYLMPQICPDYVKDIKSLQGDWGTVGSVRLWTYISGNSETVKETVEAVDEKTRTISFRLLEGEIMKYYKTYKPSFQVTAAGAGSFARWTIQYEKQNEHVPPPNNYLEFLANFNNTVDAYLLKMGQT